MAPSSTDIVLANTYHLLLRPGAEVFRRTGGIHGFMSWKRSVLTDSGGFQVWSLSALRKLTEDGVPQKAEVQRSSGFERLDRAAVDTAMRWRYVPGKRAGVAEAMWFNLPMHFVLD